MILAVIFNYSLVSLASQGYEISLEWARCPLCRCSDATEKEVAKGRGIVKLVLLNDKERALYRKTSKVTAAQQMYIYNSTNMKHYRK